MGLSNLYMIAFNATLAAGWSFVLLYTLASIRIGNYAGKEGYTTVPGFGGFLAFDTAYTPTTFYYLSIFQSFAVLEPFHVAFKLVGGTMFTAFFQVFSRMVVTWFICYVDQKGQYNYAYFLMLVAWSVTEVIRYNTYWLKIVLGTPPYFLKWCRYTFFIVLYPLGVYSEIVTNLHAISYLSNAQDEGKFNSDSEEDGYFVRLYTIYKILVWGLMALYPTVFPSMYMYMFSQRKKQLGKPRPTPPVVGIQFPEDPKGVRSSTGVNQGAFAASLLNVDREAAFDVCREKNWRFGYQKHVVKNVAISCKDTNTCLQIARDGLGYLYNRMEFIRDGKTVLLQEAMENPIADRFYTMTIKGDKNGSPRSEYVVPICTAPYPRKGKMIDLVGDQLADQLQKWVDDGSIEPSARDAIKMVAESKEWLDLSDKYFALLGTGSAMGPYLILLAHGANILAVDLDVKPVWDRIIKLARDSPGTITFPVKAEPSTLTTDDEIAASAGANLFTDAPEIADWLSKQCPAENLVIGSYAYLDGERHVRVSLAMDAISAAVIKGRKTTTSLAYLCSPTDVFVVDEATSQAAQTNYKKRCLAKSMGNFMRMFSKTANTKNYVEPAKGADGTYFINDGITVAQGPNYALAKRIQHWRSMIARAEGSPVSTNIAPSTATISVVHNKQFAAAYGGMPYFKPFEVARQETSNAVMGALLIHDVCNTKSKAYPDTEIGNPINLFKGGSFHGGVWRCGYKVGTIGETAVILFYLKQYGALVGLSIAGVASAALAYFSQ
eukprot:m.270182 g.270182  ORF g.270182 m.270182 type:complete len:776 (-) comp15677_c0_seq1:4347-6674(-)